MPDALLPLLVEPDALEAALGADGLLVVDVNEPQRYAQGHVPGAVNLAYAGLIGPRPPAMGMMAGEEQLGAALGAIGLTPDLHVVAYDSEGNGRASRLLWTLDALGHQGLSLLNGGFGAWAGEGHPVETDPVTPTPSDYAAHVANDAVIASKGYILDHLGDPDMVVLDVRSAAEYAGHDVRAARGGHIPGAVNMDWTMAMDRGRNLRFLPPDQLTALLAERGVTPDREVITHCQTHHRSAHTCWVLKSLGFPRVRGYDGSWSDWGNDPDVPIEG